MSCFYIKIILRNLVTGKVILHQFSSPNISHRLTFPLYHFFINSQYSVSLTSNASESFFFARNKSAILMSCLQLRNSNPSTQFDIHQGCGYIHVGDRIHFSVFLRKLDVFSNSLKNAHCIVPVRHFSSHFIDLRSAPRQSPQRDHAPGRIESTNEFPIYLPCPCTILIH